MDAATVSSEDDLAWLVQTANNFLTNIKTVRSDDDSHGFNLKRRDSASEVESLSSALNRRTQEPVVIINGATWLATSLTEPVLFITPNLVRMIKY